MELFLQLMGDREDSVLLCFEMKRRVNKSYLKETIMLHRGIGYAAELS